MEINITHMINDDDVPLLSGSVAEYGSNAGKFTWNNSLNYAEKRPLLKNDDDIAHAKEYFSGFGAWTKEEIENWSEKDVQGLVVQLIAGDIREMESYEDFEEYLVDAENGQVSGNIFKTESGEYYYYLGE